MTLSGLIVTIALAGLLSVILVRLSIPLLAGRGLVAIENNRTMHSGVVPKGGGAALLIAWLIVSAAMGYALSMPLSFLAAILVLAVVSWFDDFRTLPPAIRLAAHFGAAGLAVWQLPDHALVLQGLLPLPIDRMLTVLGLVWMTNLYNFMDGINGIAGAEAIAILAGYVLIGMLTGGTGPTEGLAVALAGATGGFLFWNARAAPRVFLGDTGSVPLGFIAGVLMIDLAVRGYWAAAMILPAYFVTDATLTLVKRIAAGEKPWEAHRSHAYQRAAAALSSHLVVTGAVAVANVLLISAALVSIGGPLTGLAIGATIVAVLLLWMERQAQRGRMT